MVLPPGVNKQQPGEIEQLSQDDLNKMKKDELLQALKTMMQDPRKRTNATDNPPISNANLGEKLDDLLKEFRQFRLTYEKMEKNIETLKEENSYLRESLMQHQRHLESLEA